MVWALHQYILTPGDVRFVIVASVVRLLMIGTIFRGMVEFISLHLNFAVAVRQSNVYAIESTGIQFTTIWVVRSQVQPQEFCAF